MDDAIWSAAGRRWRRWRALSCFLLAFQKQRPPFLGWPSFDGGRALVWHRRHGRAASGADGRHDDDQTDVQRDGGHLRPRAHPRKGRDVSRVDSAPHCRVGRHQGPQKVQVRRDPRRPRAAPHRGRWRTRAGSDWQTCVRSVSIAASPSPPCAWPCSIPLPHSASACASPLSRASADTRRDIVEILLQTAKKCGKEAEYRAAAASDKVTALDLAKERREVTARPPSCCGQRAREHIPRAQRRAHGAHQCALPPTCARAADAALQSMMASRGEDANDLELKRNLDKVIEWLEKGLPDE